MASDTTASHGPEKKCTLQRLLDLDISTEEGATSFVEEFNPGAGFFTSLHRKRRGKALEDLETLFAKLRDAAHVLEHGNSNVVRKAQEELRAIDGYVSGRIPIESLIPLEDESDEEEDEQGGMGASSKHPIVIGDT